VDPMSPNRAGPDTAGFTLLELIVVTIILAIITAAVIPVFAGSLSWARADRALRDVAGTVRYAGELAVIEETTYRFCMDADAGTYWIARQARVEDGEPVFEGLGGEEGEERSLPEGVAFKRLDARRDPDGRGRYITFRPTGACDHAIIRMVDNDGDEARIELKGNVGRIEVKEP